MGLEDVKDWLHYCGRCNSCKYLYRDYSSSCPAFEKFFWEPYTSSGKVWMARDIYEGKYELSNSILDKVYACTLCGNCAIQCQQEVSEHSLDIFEALREELVENGFIRSEHQAIRDNIEAKLNPYGEENDKRFEGIDDKYFKEKADVAIFVGCTTALRNKTLFKDIIEVLDHLDVDFSLIRDEVCCGSPLLTTGQKKYAKHLAEKNVKNFKALGAKTILTACAGCFRTLKKQYPEKFNMYNDDYKPEVLHLSEYLDLIIKKKDLIKSKHKIRVTFHDPCHMGRHVGVYDAPRNVLKKIKSVDFIEMPRNRDNSWCCGAGAGVKSSYSDWAVEISEDRIIEALSISKDEKGNIDYLISTCPFCERNLDDGVQSLIKKQVEDAADIEVLDLFQFVKKFLKPKQN